MSFEDIKKSICKVINNVESTEELIGALVILLTIELNGVMGSLKEK